MNVLSELKRRFQQAWACFPSVPPGLLETIRPAQDARFGDYQANCAMPLGKHLGRPPREVAAELLERLDVAELCEPPSIAGPGFINLRLRDAWLTARLAEMVHDERLGVPLASPPRTCVIDYSSPNVAKPMHVGHIRSTVIGNALDRTLRFLGHQVISDNHLGDWGTQFGMVIYGYKHFLDPQAFCAQPVSELGRLYKLVSRLVDYHESLPTREARRRTLEERAGAVARGKEQPATGNAAKDKEQAKALKRLESQRAEAEAELQALQAKLAAVEQDPVLGPLAQQHPDIAAAVLEETARLHAGDEENRRLWEEFLPHCRADIQRIYDRLQVRFDVEYGESFYHERLAGVVSDLQEKRLAQTSEGAMCVFLEGFDTPMIVQKKDGAFLYATSDLATIQYRMQTWRPDAILYVVDHRQSEHFEKLFAAARQWGYRDVELQHISFGTVLGEDGRPYKTRAGDTVGLEGLLDEAVRRASQIVAENDDSKPTGRELSEEERQRIAQVVGIAALKYADLSQNRTSDYVFSYDKMLAMKGNTATYMQYSFARVNGIFSKGGIVPDELRRSNPPLRLEHPDERALGLSLLRFPEALDDTLADYRPNQLTNYLFELTNTFFTFYENCPVLKAGEARDSRLLLCDLTSRTIARGLDLLGIQVVERM